MSDQNVSFLLRVMKYVINFFFIVEGDEMCDQNISSL